MSRRGKVVIDRERCKGCLLCIRACPVKVLASDTEPNTGGSYPSRAAYPEKCVACGNCREVCPDVCIIIYSLDA